MIKHFGTAPYSRLDWLLTENRCTMTTHLKWYPTCLQLVKKVSPLWSTLLSSFLPCKMVRTPTRKTTASRQNSRKSTSAPRPKSSLLEGKQANQHLPCRTVICFVYFIKLSQANVPAPAAELEADIAQGWILSLTDKEIHKRIVEKLDTNKYGLSWVIASLCFTRYLFWIYYSIKSFRKIRKDLGFIRSRSLGLTLSDITPILQEKRAAFPTAGYAELKKILLQENELNVPR